MKPEKIKQNSRRYFDRVADKQHIIPEPNLCYDAVLEQLRSYDFMSLADISCGTGTMLNLEVSTMNINFRYKSEMYPDSTLYL